MSVARLAAGAALGLFLLGLGMAVARGLGDGETTATPTQPAATTTAAKPKPPKPAPFVRLQAVGALDPEGDGRENDDLVPLAVDGDQATAWETERYTSFFKPGVGLVLDAGRAVRLERVIVTTGTPGYTAEIRAGSSAAGPFTTVAAARAVTQRTVFAVPKRRARYLVVWITELADGSAAAVAEVRAGAR
jgi:hypothetical protein